ncbi:hypothetical protein D3C85_1583090 [compost metagenome]
MFVAKGTDTAFVTQELDHIVVYSGDMADLDRIDLGTFDEELVITAVTYNGQFVIAGYMVSDNSPFFIAGDGTEWTFIISELDSPALFMDKTVVVTEDHVYTTNDYLTFVDVHAFVGAPTMAAFV